MIQTDMDQNATNCPSHVPTMGSGQVAPIQNELEHLRQIALRYDVSVSEWREVSTHPLEAVREYIVALSSQSTGAISSGSRSV